MTYKANKINRERKKKGGYKSLIVYWLGTTIYDLTVLFCQLYIQSFRQKEQMTQGARTGKQGIVEGSLENSVEGNLKLTGVARASYGELLEDFLDFLRQKGLPVWDKNDPRVVSIRQMADRPYKTYKSYRTYTTYTKTPESFANLMITLCYKQSYLLDRLLKANQEKFVREGGFRENLFRKRREYQAKKVSSFSQSPTLAKTRDFLTTESGA